jgi:hypothetical protein
VTDRGVTALAAACGGLRALQLRQCMGVSEAGIRLALSRCGQLCSVDLSHVPSLEDSTVAQVRCL